MWRWILSRSRNSRRSGSEPEGDSPGTCNTQRQIWHRFACSGATSCCAEHLCSPRRLHRRNAWLYSTKTHQSSMLLLSNSALLTEVLCTALRQASPSSGLAKVRKPMCCSGGCAQAADQPAGWARGWMRLAKVRKPTARADAQANAHTCLGTTLMSTSGPKLHSVMSVGGWRAVRK